MTLACQLPEERREALRSLLSLSLSLLSNCFSQQHSTQLETSTRLFLVKDQLNVAFIFYLLQEEEKTNDKKEEKVKEREATTPRRKESRESRDSKDKAEKKEKTEEKKEEKKLKEKN